MARAVCVRRSASTCPFSEPVCFYMRFSLCTIWCNTEEQYMELKRNPLLRLTLYGVFTSISLLDTTPYGVFTSISLRTLYTLFMHSNLHSLGLLAASRVSARTKVPEFQFVAVLGLARSEIAPPETRSINNVPGPRAAVQIHIGSYITRARLSS